MKQWDEMEWDGIGSLHERHIYGHVFIHSQGAASLSTRMRPITSQAKQRTMILNKCISDHLASASID
eukprot:scaffold477389_cov19-Prasinocladus_malaysianus.AAC.1